MPIEENINESAGVINGVERRPSGRSKWMDWLRASKSTNSVQNHLPALSASPAKKPVIVRKPVTFNLSDDHLSDSGEESSRASNFIDYTSTSTSTQAAKQRIQSKLQVLQEEFALQQHRLSASNDAVDAASTHSNNDTDKHKRWLKDQLALIQAIRQKSSAHIDQLNSELEQQRAENQQLRADRKSQKDQYEQQLAALQEQLESSQRQAEQDKTERDKAQAAFCEQRSHLVQLSAKQSLLIKQSMFYRQQLYALSAQSSRASISETTAAVSVKKTEEQKGRIDELEAQVARLKKENQKGKALCTRLLDELESLYDRKPSPHQ